MTSAPNPNSLDALRAKVRALLPPAWSSHQEKAAARQPEVLVEDSWIPTAELPAILGNFMRLSDQYAQGELDAWARVAAVRELHKAETGEDQDGPYCAECTFYGGDYGVYPASYPCETIKALEGTTREKD